MYRSHESPNSFILLNMHLVCIQKNVNVDVFHLLISALKLVYPYPWIQWNVLSIAAILFFVKQSHFSCLSSARGVKFIPTISGFCWCWFSLNLVGWRYADKNVFQDGLKQKLLYDLKNHSFFLSNKQFLSSNLHLVAQVWIMFVSFHHLSLIVLSFLMTKCCN